MMKRSAETPHAAQSEFKKRKGDTGDAAPLSSPSADDDQVWFPVELLGEIMRHSGWNTAVALSSTRRALRAHWYLATRTVPWKVVRRLTPQMISRFTGVTHAELVMEDRTQLDVYGYVLPNMVRHMTQITSLKLHGNRHDRGMSYSDIFSALVNLTSLDASALQSTGDEFVPRLTHLAHLKMVGDTPLFTNAGIVALASSLQSLRLVRNQTLGDDAIAGLTCLTRLSLIDCTRVSEHAILSHAPRLVSLMLSNVPGVAFVCLNKSFASLTSLGLKKCVSGDLLLRHVPRLTSLVLFEDVQLDETCFTALTSLRRLALCSTGTCVSDTGLSVLTQLVHLEVHDLAATSISDRGLSPLCNLRTLELCSRLRAKITDKALANKPRLHTLRYHDGTSQFSAAALLGLPRLGQLTVSLDFPGYPTDELTAVLDDAFKAAAKERRLFLDFPIGVLLPLDENTPIIYANQ